MPDTPEEAPEADSKSIQPTLGSVGYDDLLDDIFGLNFRALSTIKDIFIRPKTYFEAAKKPKWEERYTPSFRLALGLFAILALFKIIYSNPEGTFFQDILQIELDSTKLSGEEVDLDIATEGIKKEIYWVFSLLPFFVLLSWCAVAGPRRIWGEPLNFVVRLRYVFALAIPLMVFTIFSSLLELYFNEGQAYIWSQVTINLIGVFWVWVVAYRGPLHALSNSSKIIRGMCLTFLIHFVTLFGVIASVGVALFILT